MRERVGGLVGDEGLADARCSPASVTTPAQTSGASEAADGVPAGAAQRSGLAAGFELLLQRVEAGAVDAALRPLIAASSLSSGGGSLFM